MTKGAQELEGPLRKEKWSMSAEEREKAGPKLWERTSKGKWKSESKGCKYSRVLAAAGIAMWEDITQENGE